jgi:hypothetical protein
MRSPGSAGTELGAKIKLGDRYAHETYNKVGDAASHSLPLVVAEWRRNAREIVRVAIDEYRGRITIDLRTWYLDGSGFHRPGRSGLTLGIDHLPALAGAVADALQKARECGFITDKGRAT